MGWYGLSRHAVQVSKFDPENNQKFTTTSPFLQTNGEWARKTRRRSRERPDGSLRESMGRTAAICGLLTPRQKKFTEFLREGMPNSLELDKKEGNVWFAHSRRGSREGDIMTLKLTRWTPPASVRLASIIKTRPEEIGKIPRLILRVQAHGGSTSDSRGSYGLVSGGRVRWPLRP